MSDAESLEKFDLHRRMMAILEEMDCREAMTVLIGMVWGYYLQMRPEDRAGMQAFAEAMWKHARARTLHTVKSVEYRKIRQAVVIKGAELTDEELLDVMRACKFRDE